MSEPIDQENKFSWADTDDIVIRSVAAIAVYPNLAGDIVVRQECIGFGEEDSVIVIPASLVEQVVTALRKSADEVRK